MLGFRRRVWGFRMKSITLCLNTSMMLKAEHASVTLPLKGLIQGIYRAYIMEKMETTTS